MIPWWVLILFAIELVLLTTHVSSVVFLGRQLLRRNRFFSGAFFVIFFIQSLADLCSYLFVSTAFTRVECVIEKDPFNHLIPTLSGAY